MLKLIRRLGGSRGRADRISGVSYVLYMYVKADSAEYIPRPYSARGLWTHPRFGDADCTCRLLRASASSLKKKDRRSRTESKTSSRVWSQRRSTLTTSHRQCAMAHGGLIAFAPVLLTSRCWRIARPAGQRSRAGPASRAAGSGL